MFTLSTSANPVTFNFKNPDHGIMEVCQGPPYTIRRITPGNWKVEQDPKATNSEASVEFGSGLNSAILGNYKIIRLGKKSYQLYHNEKQCDFKTSAAIYDAVLIPNSKNLLLRIGNKTIRAISPDIETLWEIKTKGIIKSLTTGGGGFLILSKEEIMFCNSEGSAKWKLGCPPNSEYNNATWLDKNMAFLWGAGDREYYQVALVLPDGQIKNSQLFKDFSRCSIYSRIDILEDESCFVLPVSNHLECYEII